MVPLTILPMQTYTLEERAEQLVRTEIQGTRKGSKIPAYKHSLNVAGTLRRHGFDGETILAGLLHDVVEDSRVTFDELANMGFSERTLRIVKLVTHDNDIPSGTVRWVKMIGRLIDANDIEAWTVKVADTLDNYRSSESLPPERRDFMRMVKAPLILALTRDMLGHTKMWKELDTEVKLKKITR